MSVVDMSGETRDLEPISIEPAALINAEINQQIATARRYPRSVARARKQALELATLDRQTAGRCIYALPRGGKKIEGPSARLAEIVAASWGNCRFGARVVGETENFIIAQGVFHDLETNSAVTVEVQRRITDKNGRRFDVDMIGVTGQAATSIALRNAVFKGVPQALWWDVYLAAKNTAVGDRVTLAERRNEAMERFKAFGVTQAQVFQALGVGGFSDINIDHLVTLAGWATAIEEGEDPEDIFPAVETKTKPVAPAKPPTPPETAAAPSPAPAPEASAAPTPPPATSAASASSPAHADEPKRLEVEIANMIADASTPREVESLADMFGMEIAASPAHVQARIKKQISDAATRMRKSAAA